MNLEDFVKESLGQIFRGVQGAATVAQATGATIDPRQYGVPGTTDDYGRSVQSIMFDVAVTVTETGDIKGGISVIGIGVKGATSELSSTGSRIKFRVPVVLPTSASGAAERRWPDAVTTCSRRSPSHDAADLRVPKAIESPRLHQ